MARPTSVWKFPVPIRSGWQLVSMPAGSDVLCVQLQHGAPHVWAQVDPAAHHVDRRFIWFGTGHMIPSDVAMRYVGTVQLQNGMVFHLLEEMR